MNTESAIDLGRQALMTSMVIAAPVLLVGLVIGLLVGLAQTLTQIQDQTVSFVPKFVAILIALAFTLPWAIQQMVDYSRDLIENVPKVVRGVE